MAGKIPSNCMGMSTELSNEVTQLVRGEIKAKFARVMLQVFVQCPASVAVVVVVR